MDSSSRSGLGDRLDLLLLAVEPLAMPAVRTRFQGMVTLDAQTLFLLQAAAVGTVLGL